MCDDSHPCKNSALNTPAWLPTDAKAVLEVVQILKGIVHQKIKQLKICLGTK